MVRVPPPKLCACLRSSLHGRLHRDGFVSCGARRETIQIVIMIEGSLEKKVLFASF